MTLNATECSNRVTALLEYFNCAVITLLHYNLVLFYHISLKPLKVLLLYLVCIQPNFQPIPLSSLSGIRSNNNFILNCALDGMT